MTAGRFTTSCAAVCVTTVSGPYAPSITLAVPGKKLLPVIVSWADVADDEIMTGFAACADWMASKQTTADANVHATTRLRVQNMVTSPDCWFFVGAPLSNITRDAGM
jgi:hypothetical protein